MGESAEENGEYVCPSCGSVIAKDSSQCPICGESFTTEPAGKFDAELAVPATCQKCGGEIPEGRDKCPACAKAEKHDHGEDDHATCPVCGSFHYEVQTGDLVKCRDCGNAYVLVKPAEGFFTGWKWKFWIGLTFILVGDFGFALASYIHNVLKWTFLGDMYLGYGWIDSLLGVLGIVLFAVGIVLFAWSFRREREVKCTSCGVYIMENELVPTEEPKTAPSEAAVKAALSEIEEELACPNCGKTVALFDEKCPSCGQILVELTMEEKFESVEPQDAAPAPEQPLNGNGERLLQTIESLDENAPPAEEGVSVEKFIMDDLEKMESQHDVAAAGKDCPECGITCDAGATECPVCGASLKGADR
jgi:rubrerythrin